MLIYGSKESHNRYVYIIDNEKRYYKNLIVIELKHKFLGITKNGVFVTYLAHCPLLQCTFSRLKNDKANPQQKRTLQEEDF